MAKKPESSKGQQKGEKATHSQREDIHEPADFEHSAIDPLLAAGGSDPDKLASILAKADSATQERLIGRLQQTRGNLFVQRMLAQRQTSDEHSSGEHRTEDSDVNESQHTPEEWASFGSAANAGAEVGFTIFAASARLTGVRINGPIAIGGRLRGPSIGPQVLAQVLGAGAPIEVATAFGNAANKAWKRWLRRVSIPGLPMYPSFASWPGPMAPPTPSIPFPLIAIAPGASIDAGRVTSSIMASLGELAGEPGAQEAAAAFGTSLSVAFAIWITTKQLMNVLGKGPVPSWAPPYVPVGPVIMGDTIPSPGIII